MDAKKLEELEELFLKYGTKSSMKIECKNKFLNIENYKIDLNIGKTIYREKLVKNGSNDAALIVPLFDNGDVLMVVQPRVFASRGVLLDFPSGYLEKGENSIDGAIRELEEETGYRAKSMEKLLTYYQDEGITDSKVSIYLAKGIKKVSELHLDKDEFLQPYITKFSDLDELVEKGYIKSGGGQLAIAVVKLKEGI